MKVAVIIPFYNGDQYIKRCIESINITKPNSIRVYVVDNNKKTSSLVTFFNSIHEVKYIKTKPAIGFGRACNLGALIAISEGYEYLVFLNQDTTLKEDTLNILFEYAINLSDQLAVLTPMILEYNSNQPMQLVHDAYLSKNKGYLKDYHHNTVKEMYSLPTIGAACIMVSKRVIKAIGLFDPVFYMYGEDYDFFKRLYRKGGTLFLIPFAKVHHFAGINITEKALAKSRDIEYGIAQVIKQIRYSSLHQGTREFCVQSYSLARHYELVVLLRFLFRGLSRVLLNIKSILDTCPSAIKRRIEMQSNYDTLS